MSKQRCSVMVPGINAYRHRNCSRKAVVFEGDVGFCKQHSPKKVQERLDAKEAEFLNEQRRRNVPYKTIIELRKKITKQSAVIAHCRATLAHVFDEHISRGNAANAMSSVRKSLELIEKLQGEQSCSK